MKGGGAGGACPSLLVNYGSCSGSFERIRSSGSCGRREEREEEGRLLHSHSHSALTSGEDHPRSLGVLLDYCTHSQPSPS
jgi:hypothetical protein